MKQYKTDNPRKGDGNYLTEQINDGELKYKTDNPRKGDGNRILALTGFYFTDKTDNPRKGDGNHLLVPRLTGIASIKQITPVKGTEISVST